MRSILVVIGVALTSISGCASNKTADPAGAREISDDVLKHLVHTTRDVQRQWGLVNRLTELRSGNSQPVLELSRTEPSLRRVFTYPGGYQGELEPLIQSIAATSGYAYLPPIGRKPIRGIPVLFAEEMRTLAEYLFDAGMQAGDRADVIIDMKSQTLQVQYTGY